MTVTPHRHKHGAPIQLLKTEETDVNSKPKKKPHYQRVDLAILQSFMRRRRLNGSDVARRLGVSASTPTAWLRQGWMPRAMSLAVEQLDQDWADDDNVEVILDQTAPTTSAGDPMFLASCPADKVKRFTALCAMLGVEIVSFDE